MSRHHLVPRMMLKRFARDQRIMMVPREGNAPAKRTSVGSACAENGFYRIETSDLEEHAREGHDPEHVEHLLASIESDASPLIDVLCSGRMPEDEQDVVHLGLFVALQASRGQAFREDLGAFLTAEARLELRASHDVDRLVSHLTEKGLPHAPEDVAEFQREMFNGPWKVVLPQGVMVQESIRFAVTRVLPELLCRSWTLMRFEHPSLLTSDTPVVPWSPPAPAWMPPPAWATAARILFPLDRRTCLAFERHGAGQVVAATPRDAEVVNRAVATEARRWIYHHPDDRPLDGIALPPLGVVVQEFTGVRFQPDGSLVTTGQLVKRPRRRDAPVQSRTRRR